MPLVLGLDPGSRLTGYGLVTGSSRRPLLAAAGTIRAPQGGDLAARLAAIFGGVAAVIDQHRPSEAVLEGVFTARNAQSALKLGQARGVALLACAQAGLPVFEYAPAEVKKGLTGNGRAPKEQVRTMVQALLRAKGPLALDASDALALALTHLNRRGLRERGLL